MMTVLGSFLFLITAHLASSSWIPGKARFQPNALEDDLQTISQYYNNIDRSLFAYIHWPKSLNFRVHSSGEGLGNLLEIDGLFEIPCTSTRCSGTQRLNSLFYKDGKFYANSTAGASMEEISRDENLYYTAPSIKPEVKDGWHLSISYFDASDVRAFVRSKYLSSVYHYNAVLRKHPATFVLINTLDRVFLEYTFKNDVVTRPIHAGNLRVLITSKNNSMMEVTGNLETGPLIFYPKKHFDFTILDDYDDSNDIVGIRMATVGLLAEHVNFKVRLLSSSDLVDGSANPDGHVVSSSDFLEKVRNVEIRPAISESGDRLLRWQLIEYLQIKGHVLRKSANYDDKEKMNDPMCPFDIQFDDMGSYFQIGSKGVLTICTDEVRLWPKGGTPSDNYINDDIKLMYN